MGIMMKIMSMMFMIIIMVMIMTMIMIMILIIIIIMGIIVYLYWSIIDTRYTSSNMLHTECIFSSAIRLINMFIAATYLLHYMDHWLHLAVGYISLWTYALYLGTSYDSLKHGVYDGYCYQTTHWIYWSLPRNGVVLCNSDWVLGGLGVIYFEYDCPCTWRQTEI